MDVMENNQNNLNNENTNRWVIERVIKYDEMDSEYKVKAVSIAAVGIAALLTINYLVNTYDIDSVPLFITCFFELSSVFMYLCKTLIRKVNLKKELIQDLKDKLAMNGNNDLMKNDSTFQENRGRSR